MPGGLSWIRLVGCNARSRGVVIMRAIIIGTVKISTWPRLWRGFMAILQMSILYRVCAIDLVQASISTSRHLGLIICWLSRFSRMSCVTLLSVDFSILAHACLLACFFWSLLYLLPFLLSPIVFVMSRMLLHFLFKLNLPTFFCWTPSCYPFCIVAITVNVYIVARSLVVVLAVSFDGPRISVRYLYM